MDAILSVMRCAIEPLTRPPLDNTPTTKRLAWAGLSLWLGYSAACLVWWFLADPLRFQMICRALQP